MLSLLIRSSQLVVQGLTLSNYQKQLVQTFLKLILATDLILFTTAY